jgi:hypothetical protein
MASRDRFKIQATPAADRAIRDLRGTTAKRYAQLENELRAQGCAAAGYRLLAPDSGNFSLYCCKHRDRRWRAITTFAPVVDQRARYVSLLVDLVLADEDQVDGHAQAAKRATQRTNSSDASQPTNRAGHRRLRAEPRRDWARR